VRLLADDHPYFCHLLLLLLLVTSHWDTSFFAFKEADALTVDFRKAKRCKHILSSSPRFGIRVRPKRY